MKLNILFLFFCVMVGLATGSTQILQRLHYIEGRIDHIEERLNMESKQRREDFFALFEKLEQIQSKQDSNYVPEENKRTTPAADLSSLATRHHETHVAGTLQNLIQGLKSEKLENSRIRREIPTLKDKMEELKESVGHQEIANEQILTNLEIIIGTTVNLAGNVTKLQSAMEEIKACKNITENSIIQHSNALHNDATKICANTTNQVITVLENISAICQSKAEIMHTTKVPNSRPKHSSCNDVKNSGQKENGVHQIDLNGDQVPVFCDLTTDGGGWTVFQRRQDGSEDFFRNWEDYKSGFGDLNGEFWLGNEYLHQMTSTSGSKRLRIDLKDYTGNFVYAEYSNFRVSGETDKYMLHIETYNGNASDSLSRHNDKMFSTKDNDNDPYSSNCAQLRHGGYWYADCTDSNLNGWYEKSSKCTKEEFSCVHWYYFKKDHRPFEFIEMKFR